MRYILHATGPELVDHDPPPPHKRLATYSRHAAFAGTMLGARLRDIRWSSLTGLAIYRFRRAQAPKVPAETR